MSREVIRELIDRWFREPAFREAISQDPEGAVRLSGAELDADELAALRNWHCVGQKKSKQGHPLFFWYEFLPLESHRNHRTRT